MVRVRPKLHLSASVRICSSERSIPRSWMLGRHADTVKIRFHRFDSGEGILRWIISWSKHQHICGKFGEAVDTVVEDVSCPASPTRPPVRLHEQRRTFRLVRAPADGKPSPLRQFRSRSVRCEINFRPTLLLRGLHNYSDLFSKFSHFS